MNEDKPTRRQRTNQGDSATASEEALQDTHCGRGVPEPANACTNRQDRYLLEQLRVVDEIEPRLLPRDEIVAGFRQPVRQARGLASPW